MKRITLKGVALVLGLCAAAGLSAGAQADGGYNTYDNVWILNNAKNSKSIKINKDKEDINKDKKDKEDKEDKEDINKDKKDKEDKEDKEDINKYKEKYKEGVKKYKEYIKKGKKYIKKGKKDDDGDKESVISLAGLFEEEKKPDKGSIEGLCQEMIDGFVEMSNRMDTFDDKLQNILDLLINWLPQLPVQNQVAGGVGGGLPNPQPQHQNPGGIPGGQQQGGGVPGRNPNLDQRLREGARRLREGARRRGGGVGNPLQQPAPGGGQGNGNPQPQPAPEQNVQPLQPNLGNPNQGGMPGGQRNNPNNLPPVQNNQDQINQQQQIIPQQMEGYNPFDVVDLNVAVDAMQPI